LKVIRSRQQRIVFVGGEREFDVLERRFAEARSELRMVDVAAEPGMGKSRLLHEFRQRIGKDHAFILSESCSPDTQQTPFFPFIEVVRGSFRVSAGEAENEAARKLERGLSTLGLHSARNLGLLRHLLGLKVPESALPGHAQSSWCDSFAKHLRAVQEGRVGGRPPSKWCLRNRFRKQDPEVLEPRQQSPTFIAYLTAPTVRPRTM
jgi:predicted ATPase